MNWDELSTVPWSARELLQNLQEHGRLIATAPGADEFTPPSISGPRASIGIGSPVSEYQLRVLQTIIRQCPQRSQRVLLAHWSRFWATVAFLGQYQNRLIQERVVLAGDSDRSIRIPWALLDALATLPYRHPGDLRFGSPGTGFVYDDVIKHLQRLEGARP